MPRSNAWDFFTVCVDNERFAKCNACGAKISRGPSKNSYSTTPMRNHLKGNHSAEYRALISLESGNHTTAGQKQIHYAPGLPDGPTLALIDYIASAPYNFFSARREPPFMLNLCSLMQLYSTTSIA